VKNSIFTNCARKVTGTHSIYIYRSSNITIENNRFFHIGSGITATGSGNNIKITNNTFKDKALDFFPPGSQLWGAFIQFGDITGSGHEISYNQMAFIPFQVHPKGERCRTAVGAAGTGCTIPDNINLYRACGTPGSPIRVIGNYMKGGSDSTAAFGIQTGDSSLGKAPCGNILVQYNTVIDTSGGGMMIGGGQNITFLDNLIWGSTRPGNSHAFAAFDWLNSGGCRGHTVKGMIVNWKNALGQDKPSYMDGSCSPINGIHTGNTSTNNWNANITRCSKHPRTPEWRLDVDYPECKSR
jgi:parallel beta-helix repeat protein